MTARGGAGSRNVDRRTLARRGLAAVALSLLVNWVVLQVVLAAELVEPFDPLAFPPVTLLTALGAIAATAVYVSLSRYSETPNRAFTVAAAIALLLSFVPTLSLLQLDPDATVPAVIALMGMHVTVAVVCVASLTGRLPGLE